MDEPPLRVHLLYDALNGVVERIAENRADVRHVDRIQQLPVRDAGELDPVLTHDSRFPGNQRVENRIAGLLFRPEILQLLLELRHPELPFLRIQLRTHTRDLML